MKVFVGLSGGVDSAVAAALLKKEGHEVTGCFIKIWQPEFIECTWREDRLDAMRVASKLQIPFREIDLSNEYKREVVDDMVKGYACGITPNPDVLCNSSIKFGHFLRWALEQGADMVATGHYARSTNNDIVSRYSLLRGTDRNKDQSYFLWQLGQHELSHALFPIGNLRKEDVRKLARRFRLPNADKPDSQGLCFVGDVSMEDFLRRFIPIKPGEVLDLRGNAIGKHKGAALYTIGQRHGFVVDTTKTVHYVVATDSENNTITVSADRNDATKKEIILEKVRWIGEEPALPLEAEAETRYREIPVPIRIEKSPIGTKVIFSEAHIVAPGQSLVLYQGDRCLGGAIISGTMIHDAGGNYSRHQSRRRTRTV